MKTTVITIKTISLTPPVKEKAKTTIQNKNGYVVNTTAKHSTPVPEEVVITNNQTERKHT